MYGGKGMILTIRLSMPNRIPVQPSPGRDNSRNQQMSCPVHTPRLAKGASATWSKPEETCVCRHQSRVKFKFKNGRTQPVLNLVTERYIMHMNTKIGVLSGF